MNDFIAWYETKYGPYPGEPNEDYAVVFARMATAMAEWADICSKRTRNMASKFVRSQKRLARARKIKAVALADITQLRQEYLTEKAHSPEVKAVVNQIPLLKLINQEVDVLMAEQYQTLINGEWR